MNEFKDMLAYLRKREGYTQKELAEALKLSTSTIGMYESGKRFPERETEELIADFFNVSLSFLRGIAEAEPTEENATMLAAIMKDKELADYVKKLIELPKKKKEVLYKYIDFLSLED